MPEPDNRQHEFCVRRNLGAWFAGYPGQLLLDAERLYMEGRLPDMFGYHLLQVGRLGEQDLLAASRIPHRVVLELGSSQEARSGGGPVARADALPFGADTVDVIVLPHVLEFETAPHQVLREIERVLIPEGYLVISGFNPWSLWGLWRLVLSRAASPPWCGRFFGMTRIRDWLSLLGFDVVDQTTVFFRPPLRSEKLMTRLAGLERLGARFSRHLGGAYLIVARKQVLTLTPIRPQWKRHRSLVGPGIVEPTTREQA